MNEPRWSFSPCMWKREIYLCDGYTAEVFNTENRSFRAIKADFANKRDTCAYVFADKLVIMSADGATTLGYREGSLEVSNVRHTPLSPASQCQPAVWENLVYWFSYGELITANAETGNITTTKRRY
jgi:hypothetical protein